MNGRPLDGMLFSAHISNTCHDDSNWRPKPVNFECPPEMRSAIFRAIEKAPTRKAPGFDEVKNEMLKIDVDLSTELLCELWAAC